MTLLDELMPVYHFAERHRIEVRATPARVYGAIRTADLAGGVVTRVLFSLRALPAALLTLARSPRAAGEAWRGRSAAPYRGLRLADFERAGFRVVAEREPEEVVLGLLGRFWTPRGDLDPDVSAAHFAAGPPGGYALAGWNFTVDPTADGGTDLRTETRVWCAPDAHAAFRAYWLLVRPGSGLIRGEMLGSIRSEAERPSGEESRPLPAHASRSEEQAP